MSTILRSVGKNGANIKSDVETVQTLLKAKGYDAGIVDGRCGNGTIGAIIKFQSSFMSKPDGVIDPNGGSWRRLSGTGTQSQTTNSPVLTEWGGKSEFWPHEKKMLSLFPAMRPKVEAVLQAMRDRGWRPKVFFAWRSVAVQMEIYRRGDSKVTFSFHTAQKKDGTPNAYAVDIVDERYAWDGSAEGMKFFRALGEEGKKQGLYWGGDWQKFKDWAHLQYYPNSQLKVVKAESGF